MLPCKARFVVVALGFVCTQSATAEPRFGAQGAEVEPGRMQQWQVPSPDPDIAARALRFRPPGDGPFALALIAHATTQNVLRRAQMPQPEYHVLAAWLVARGFAVLVPERSGHGATGGRYLEGQGGCDEANYSRSGHATADSIVTALGYLRGQSFVRAARVPVTWLVAANDSYFSPDLSRQLADAFRSGGGRADFRVLPASGSEGHWLVGSEAGVKSVGPELDRALKLPGPTAAKKR